MRRSGRDFPTATGIPVDGPLGATDAQQALDLIAAAGPFFTTEATAAYVLGVHPLYSTLKTFSLATGTSRHILAYVDFTGGTAVTPTAMSVTIRATARRESGGTVYVSSPATQTAGNISSFGINWAVSGTDAVLQFRGAGGPTVRVTLRYSWTEQLPP